MHRWQTVTTYCALFGNGLTVGRNKRHNPNVLLQAVKPISYL